METISLGVILGILAITYLQPPTERAETNILLKVKEKDEYEELL
jgi:hypothetical protein